jgi:glycosyltransferase involved in cell wall biosynthesis
MPKIVRIINRFNLGGPTYNVSYLAQYLAPEFETLLIGGVKDETEASSDYIIQKSGLDPVIISSMKRSINPLNDYESYRQIRKLIQDFKPDIVHTHAAKAGAIGRLAAFSCKVPYTVHTFHGHVFHSYFGRAKTGVFKMIERELGKRTSAIIAISEKQKAELSGIHRIAPPEKIKVIPLGFDLDRFQENMDQKRASFRKQYLLGQDEVAIGIIGRLVPVKNHALFLNAIHFAAQSGSGKIRAFIIGDGEEIQKLRSLANDLNIGQLVTFTSWIKEVDWALAGLDIVCLTSYNEGTPVSLIEAQAANKPIVSTNVGGIENSVIPNKTALLADINDANAYNSLLLKLIESPHLRHSLGSAGWEQVKEKFHFKRLVSDTRNLYYSLLNS